MSTSVHISDDVHLMIKKKQIELLDKGKVAMITIMIIRYLVDLIIGQEL